jgi:hypothetical protein
MPDDGDTERSTERDTERDDVTTSWRQRLAAGAVIVALGGGIVVGTRDASGDQTRPAVVEQLRDEIDAMVASGMSESDPKVEMLQDELDAIESRVGEEGRPEPGVDLSSAGGAAAADTPAEAQAQVQTAAAEPPPADHGLVECEPVPPRLAADEVADGRCVAVPQPDGTRLYVVVRPNGAVHIVEFLPGGIVRRRDDDLVPPAADPTTVELVPEPDGDVLLRSGAQRVGELDL